MWRFGLALLFFGSSAVAVANDGLRIASQTYGTQSESILTIAATAFQAEPGDGIWDPPGIVRGYFWQRWSAGAPHYLSAPVHLPAGALITKLEIDGCDASQWDAIGAELHACPSNGSCLPPLGGMITSVPGTPGCTRFSIVVSPSPTVDNTTYVYTFVYKQTADVGAAMGIRAARVYYKLQVSPAPAIATFADVPTSHPFHQFVEALVAAGITAGCGGGNYCPNDPITRGQMAVFLSRALGLHWP